MSWNAAIVSCIYSNKDKNFKANHNAKSALECGCSVVSIVTKIRILKQITTTISVQDLRNWLYL